MQFLSLSLCSFLWKRRRVVSQPSFCPWKRFDGEGREGRNERKEGKRKRFAISCIPFALPALPLHPLEHRVSFAFPFGSPIPFAFPYFLPPSLSFFTGSSLSFRTRSRNKNNGERFLEIPKNLRAKHRRCRSVNTCAKRRERNKRGGKKERFFDGGSEDKRGYKFCRNI